MPMVAIIVQLLKFDSTGMYVGIDQFFFMSTASKLDNMAKASKMVDGSNEMNLING